MTEKGKNSRHINEDHIQKAWDKLEPLLEDSETKQFTIKRMLFNSYGIAAGLLLLIFSVSVYFKYFKQDQISHQTQYGQTARVILPDHPVVNLNGNSKLTYNSDWNAKEDREVWLEGEAYFSVVHTNTNQRFYVKTKEGMQVEVLGTEFNMSKRKTGTRVVLSSGKIKLSINNDSHTNNIVMRPGEMVAFNDTVKIITKKMVNPELYSSWKNKKLLFQETELQEVMQMLEDTYGVRVKVKDPELLDKKISGSAPSGNLNLLITGLSETFDLEITKSGKLISISDKQQNKQ